MLARSSYLISYQYYRKERLRNPPDKHAVIIRNKKGFCCTKQFCNSLLKYLWRHGFFSKTKGKQCFWKHPKAMFKSILQESMYRRGPRGDSAPASTDPDTPCTALVVTTTSQVVQAAKWAIRGEGAHTPYFELQHRLLGKCGLVLKKQEEWSILPFSPFSGPGGGGRLPLVRFSPCSFS